MPERTMKTPEVEEHGESAGAIWRIGKNLFHLPKTASESLIRHGRPTSDRAASQAIFTNFFLHILPARIHRYSLQLKATLGLGVISLVLFGLLTFTGIALMIYYKPSTVAAYDSMKDIQYVVPTGRLMRNIHRWGAHAMVACVMLHMARVFFTGAYKQPREFNWVVGIALLVLTLGLSFTGYLLPWDQLAFWAVTIGSAIAESPKEVTDTLGITSWFDIGGMTKHLLLGANHVGQEALTRFYLLHVIVLPLATSALIGLHFWRIRKDGGLTHPQSEDELPADLDTASGQIILGTPESAPSKTYGLMAIVPGKTPAVDRALANTIPAWPNALYAIGALSMLTMAAMLLLGYFFDAPLAELANPAVPENPAKAPWYFLGLQEMVSYSAFMGGIGIPTLVVIGLSLMPYLDRERSHIGEWFGGHAGQKVCWISALVTFVVVVGVLAFTVNYGWLRNAYPSIDQWVITLVNPGTVLLLALAIWSFGVTWVTDSTRMGTLAMFSCLLVGFVILTYFATVHRGPNWDFYWWPSLWPSH